MGRLALAGLSVAGIAALASKPGSACERDFVCRGCGELARCGLPQGRSARAEARRAEGR